MFYHSNSIVTKTVKVKLVLISTRKIRTNKPMRQHQHCPQNLLQKSAVNYSLCSSVSRKDKDTRAILPEQVWFSCGPSLSKLMLKGMNKKINGFDCYSGAFGSGIFKK